MVSIMSKPINLGPLTLKNRFVMSAMATGMLELSGEPNERFIRYLERRAEGEVAMLILESTGVVDHFRYNVRTPSLASDDSVKSWRKLSDRIHQNNCLVCVQLQHPGRQTYAVSIGETVGASPVPTKVTGEVPRELTITEIKELAESFGQSARRAREADIDAVELHGGHGYLFSQFLSPGSNIRNDKYGGSLENRFRFLKETIQAIQKAAGEDFPVIVRLSFGEFVEDGVTFEEAVQVSRWLQDMGIVSIRVSGGNLDQSIPAMIPPTDVKKGIFWEFSEKVKNAIDLPIDAVGRIQTPEEAERLLEEGVADYISLGRPLLADPDFVKKALSGNSNFIRPCIACNQGCIDRLLDHDIGEISCLVNQEVGRESENLLSKSKVTHEVKRRVLVVGGGPAGMEAARVAAVLNHEVTLVDKNEHLGGTFTLAAIPPGKQDFTGLLEYFPVELNRLGVEIILNKEISYRNIAAFNPDVIIWATGSERKIPDFESTTIPTVSNEDVYDLLDMKVRNPIIYGATWEGVETALYLRDKGYNVRIVEKNPKIGQKLSPVTRRWYLRKKLKEQGVSFYEGVTDVHFVGETCKFKTVGEEVILPCDLVILESEKKSRISAFQESSIEQIIIGDAKSPKNAYYAVRDGFEAALSIR